MGEMADAIRESTAVIVALRAENACLQERVEELDKRAEVAEARLDEVRPQRDALRARVEEAEGARETLAELHESIASQLEAAGYVTPTPVAVEQLLALAERRKSALEWYENRAKALVDFIKKPDSYLLAIYTELSLDGGQRARAAIEEEKKD